MSRLLLIFRKFAKYTSLLYVLVPLPALGQIVPDATLPINSSVTNQGETNVIEGGTTKGSNLFHSFNVFTIPTNSTAYFNNSVDVQNIFTRVTGSSVSSINGLIQSNGMANLFLINPNGIIFGPNASLNIGGSFFGSTARDIQFADGTQFSAKNPAVTPLLTVSAPIGLGLISNVGGEIEVQGTGKSLVPLTNTFAPLTKANTLTGLQVQPGKTLALVGGNVVLKGGTLTTQGGRIEIGSVDSGFVKLNLIPEGWTLGYEGVSTFKDIELSQGALIDASGTDGGSVQVQGSTVKLTEGSVILIQNQGAQPSGSLVVKAVESLELNGASTDGTIPTTIRTQPISDGNGGDIVVRTLRLIVQDGAGINSITYGSGKGGNVNVDTSNTIDVLGYSPIRASFNSNIAAYAFASGNAGNVTVSTGNLTITNGGAVNSSSLGIGKGGEVTIDARNSVKITGANPKTLAPSLVGASAFNTGNAGILIINTSKLVIEDGGAVSSVTLASGSAGSVTINASDSVKLSGKLPNVVSAGTISSSAYIADPVVQQIFKLPPKPSGRSGNVTINTEDLSIADGGLITVNNDGDGNAGNLVINANNILLENTGRISAATTSGEGGDIKLQTQNLQLTNNSSITATSNGTGNGGNIIINTDTLAAIKNSDITANAFKGSGGNIEIAAQGIFGIESRTRLTPLSDITASSELGISGTVQVDTLATQLISTTTLSENIAQPPEITSICQANSNTGKNTFVTTGTGGIPPNPDNFLSTNSGWSDRPTVPQNENSLKKPLPVVTTQVIEAQGWRQNPDGTVILTVDPTEVSPNSSQATLGCKQTSSSRITPSIKDRNLK